LHADCRCGPGGMVAVGAFTGSPWSIHPLSVCWDCPTCSTFPGNRCIDSPAGPPPDPGTCLPGYAGVYTYCPATRIVSRWMPCAGGPTCTATFCPCP
jgi:hypothetical protein